jgi:alpha-1,6-mannosyltransferase
VARARQIPLVAFFHSNLPRILGLRFGSAVGRGVERYLRQVYQRFDLVLAPSRQTCDYLEGLGVQRTALQPLGVDTETFAPHRRTLDLRRMLELPADTRLLVYAGRFSGEKHIDVLHSAFKRLGARYHLLLLGGGVRSRPAPNITRVPYLRDGVELASWIASCDAFVHAGTAETFGLVILEAMACGRPIVGVRAGSVPEHVDESVGLLARPLDAADLADAVAALYDRDIEQLGAAARERVMQQYSWTRAFRLQLAHYAALSGQGHVMSEVGAERSLQRIETQGATAIADRELSAIV